MLKSIDTELQKDILLQKLPQVPFSHLTSRNLCSAVCQMMDHKPHGCISKNHMDPQPCHRAHLCYLQVCPQLMDIVTNDPNSCTEWHCAGSTENSLCRMYQCTSLKAAGNSTCDYQRVKRINQKLAGIGIHVVSVNEYTVSKGTTHQWFPPMKSKQEKSKLQILVTATGAPILSNFI